MARLSSSTSGTGGGGDTSDGETQTEMVEPERVDRSADPSPLVGPEPEPVVEPEPEPAPEPPTDIDPPDTIDRSADPEPIVGSPDRTAPDSGGDGGVTDQIDRSADPEPVLGADGAAQTPQDAAESTTDAAEQVTDSADDAMTGDLGGGLQPGEPAGGPMPGELPSPRRVTMRNAIADRATQQTGVRVNPSDVTLQGQVVRTDEGYRLREGGSARLDAGVRERVVAERIETERGIDASASDVFVDGDDVAVRGETRDQLEFLNAAGMVGGTTAAQRERLDQLDALQRAEDVARGRMQEGRREQRAEVFGEALTQTGATAVSLGGEAVTGGLESVFGGGQPQRRVAAEPVGAMPMSAPDEQATTVATITEESDIDRGEMSVVEGALQPLIGPPGAAERTVGGAVEGAAQPVIGPPGQTEQTAGSLWAGFAGASADVAAAADERVVQPVAGEVGRGIAEFNTLLTRPDLVAESGDGEGRVIKTDPGVEAAATSFSYGVGSTGTELIRAPQTATGAATAVGGGLEFTAEQLSEEGVVGGLQTAGRAGSATVTTVAGGVASQAAQNPFQTVGAVAGGAGLAAGGGRLLGTAARGARGRIRTAGATDVDLEDITEPGVVRYFDEGEGGERFPSARDPELFDESQATALRRQAEANEPEGVAEVFEEAGVEGTTLQKALGVEPEGPGSGRAAQGLSVGDEAVGAYETPGASFGPALSPNFLRVQPRSAEFSLRPGLPDLGDRPTGVFARSGLRETDAPDREAFSRELFDADDDDFRTLPPDEATAAEAEAIAPPGAEFVDVPSGPLRDPLRRLGIGADYATEVRGQRVPLRVVAPEDRIETPGSRTPLSLFDDERAQVGAAGARGRVTRSLSRRGDVDPPVDRPLPLPASPSASLGGAEPTSGRPSPGVDIERPPSSPSFTDYAEPRPVSEPSDGVAPPASTGSPFGEPYEPGAPTVPVSEPGVPSRGSPFEPTEGGYDLFPPTTSTGTPPSQPDEPVAPSYPPGAPPGSPQPPAEPPARPPRVGYADEEPAAPEFPPEPRDPETTPFTNPIAGVFDGLFGGDGR